MGQDTGFAHPFKGSALLPSFSFWVSPMAAGIGAIIGPVFALFWFGGAIFGYYLLTPIGIKAGLFGDLAAADIFRQNLGIGLMIGTGLGVFIHALFSKILRPKKLEEEKPEQSRRTLFLISLVLLLAVILLSLGTELGFVEALVLIVGIYLTTYLSAMLTGQTGINPMEIFGILVLLVIQLISKPSLLASFSIAAVVAVACGLTGDVMNDLKSGHLLGTNPRDQILGEGIGGDRAILSVIVLLAMRMRSELRHSPAARPQAAAVAKMVGGTNICRIPDRSFRRVGALPDESTSATLGLGVYLQ